MKSELNTASSIEKLLNSTISERATDKVQSPVIDVFENDPIFKAIEDIKPVADLAKGVVGLGKNTNMKKDLNSAINSVGK